jgi:glycosyltransferase involved in cell wall biosynthesis
MALNEHSQEVKDILAKHPYKEGQKPTDPPLVTAVMITSGTRGQFISEAVHSFLQQSYLNKELLIINHGDKPIGCKNVDVREIHTPQKGITTGALRNLGLKHALGQWIIQWDDDDYSHPHRIAVQMAHRQEGCAVILTSQIRYSFLSDCAFGYYLPVDGIAGTILHPKDPEDEYDDVMGVEDSRFYIDRYTRRRVVLHNAAPTCGPELYVRFYHGNNLCDEKHVMKHMTDCVGEWDLLPHLQDYLKRTLKRYTWVKGKK